MSLSFPLNDRGNKALSSNDLLARIDNRLDRIDPCADRNAMEKMTLAEVQLASILAADSNHAQLTGLVRVFQSVANKLVHKLDQLNLNRTRKLEYVVGRPSWTGVFEQLIQLVDSPREFLQDAAMSMLSLESLNELLKALPEEVRRMVAP